MRPIICLAAVLLIGGPVQATKVKGDASYKEGDKIVITASDLSSPDVQLLWDFNGTGKIDWDENTIFVADPNSTKDKPLPDKVVQGGKCAVWAEAGKYTVTLTAVDFTTKKIQRTRFNFTVEAKIPPPPPEPPVPPKPPEPPTPPTPPAPINDTGFRVLIVYETGELSKLPAAQRLITTSGTLRDYLRSKCAPDSSANQDGRAYRIWDKDTDTSNELKSWQDAMKRERKSIPWIIVSNGKTGYEGPLPADVDSTLALLKKYELPATTNKKGK